LDKFGLSQFITILANLGVIGGILLLAYELRQNNELMSAEARFNRLSITVDQYSFRQENPEFDELIWKATQGESLSPFEESRVESWALRALLLREWSYRELPESELPVRRWRENTRTLNAHVTVFERQKENLDPGFVEWYEENIVSR
jgi:hypothetical protein